MVSAKSNKDVFIRGRFFTTLLGAVCSLLLLAGCGFHLRGSDYRLAYSTIYVQSAVAVNPALTQAVQQSLRSAHTHITATRDEAAGVLLLQGEDNQRRPLSVSAKGKAQEFELHYSVTYALETPKGKSLLAPQTVTQTRVYSFDSAAVLGKSGEEDLLWQDMRRDAAQEIVRRLAALTPHS